jgi:hypothetical protein
MINRLIGGFVSILIGVSLVDPLAQQVGLCSHANTTGTTAAAYNGCYEALKNASTWSTTIVGLVPGFFALGVLGIGLAVCYGALQDAGVV